MKQRHLWGSLILAAGSLFATSANAFLFFLLPLPNLSKPPQLESVIDALEKSDETKALATVSEDKTFGRKQWAWGQKSGRMTQEEANASAMSACSVALSRVRNESAGGKPLYDFGSKSCELYAFKNRSLLLPEVAVQPVFVAPNGPAPAAPAIYQPTPVLVTPTPAPEVATVVVPAPTNLPAPQAEGATARRLTELDELLRRGLITQDEYNRKRQGIIDSM